MSRTRSEQRSSRDSSLENRSRIHPSSLPCKELRHNHSPHRAYRASSSPLHRKSFSSPPSSRHPFSFVIKLPPQRASRTLVRSTLPSSLLSRLTRPTSSSSLKQVDRHTSLCHNPFTQSKHQARLNNYKRHDQNVVSNYNDNHISPNSIRNRRVKSKERCTKMSPSSSVSSITSAYSSASMRPRSRNLTGRCKKLGTKFTDDEFGTSTNGDELDEIDARLNKLKKFMNEHL